jgi:hypothetical protein
VVLRGLYDCITKRVIPDPDTCTKTMNRGSSRRGRILTREWYLEKARVGLRTEVFCFESGETWHVRGRIHNSRLTVLIERDAVSTFLSVSHSELTRSGRNILLRLQSYSRSRRPYGSKG